MTWNLFIDDERYLDDVTWAPWEVREKYRNEQWVIVRNVASACSEIVNRGMPSFISFDHDLGQDQPSGYELVKILIADALDYPDQEEYQFPKDFSFYVHSQNPIGKASIEALINGYMEFKNAGLL
jgi:hypothetical protein